MDNKNISIEIPKFDLETALELLYKGLDEANRRGCFSLNDSGKLKDAFVHIHTEISKLKQEINNYKINGQEFSE